MLVFNPYYRATLTECLQHPFLASVWVPEWEDQDVAELKFDFEDEGDLSETRLWEMLIDEIEHFENLWRTNSLY